MCSFDSGMLLELEFKRTFLRGRRVLILRTGVKSILILTYFLAIQSEKNPSVYFRYADEK